MLRTGLPILVGALLLATPEAFAQRLFAGDPGIRFTAEQAQRGQAAYSRACVSCHGAALEGSQFGPTLKGDGFEGHWKGRSRAEFSEHLRSSMPPRGLGSVSGKAYTDIEAWLLQMNGHRPVDPGSAPVPQLAVVANESPESRTAGARPPPTMRRTDDDPLYDQILAARAAKLAALTPVTDAVLREPPAADWLLWRRRYDGLGFSPLTQINKNTVARLRTAWSWSLPESMNEITPLVHDGVMFLTSGPVVQALDAATGELLWQYLRVLPDEFDNGRAGRVKSLAIHGERIFAPTTDGHLLALEMRSGRVLWDHEVIPETQRTMDGKPNRKSVV